MSYPDTDETGQPPLNEELLDRVVAYAIAHSSDVKPDVDPDVEWDQATWRLPIGPLGLSRLKDTCGTAMCVAGITAHLTGARWLDVFGQFDMVVAELDEVISGRVSYHTVEDYVLPDVPLADVERALGISISARSDCIPAVSIACRAARRLGLDTEDEIELFSGDYSTVTELERRVAAIKARRHGVQS